MADDTKSDLSESAWSRGWKDAKRCFADWRFWAVEVLGGGGLALINPVLGLLFVVCLAIAVWFGATISAPVRQRDEAREAQSDLETDLEKAQTARIGFKVTNNCIWINGNTASISVAVENASDTMLRDVFVELDRFVNGLEILNLPRKLKPRDEPGPKFDLPPRRTQYVVVATVNLEPNTRIEYQFVDRQKSDVSNPGKYKIKLKVYGDSIRPINQFFPLIVSENGNEIIFGNASLHIDPPPDPD